MLPLRVGEPLRQVGHRVVERQATDRQLRLVRLILLVLGHPLLGAPLILLLEIHLVERLDLPHPGVDDRVDAALVGGTFADDVGDEVEVALLAVHHQFHIGS